MRSKRSAIALPLLVAMTANVFADPRLQDLDLDGPDIYGPKPGPHPVRVTLHMRSVDGRPLKIDLATSTSIVHGRRGGTSRIAKAVEPLCTTPCNAVVPWGHAFFVISDIATNTKFKLESDWLNDDSTLNVNYVSHEEDRRRFKHNLIIGGTTGAVLGYVTSALIIGLESNQRSHYYTYDPLAAVAGAFYGAIIGVMGSGQDLDDRITTSVLPDR